MRACKSRSGQRAMGWQGLKSYSAEIQASARASEQAAGEVCEVCSRTFRRVSDRKRHKCSSERQKPVWEQQ